MSATTCRLQWSITIEDHSHWSREHKAQCDFDDPDSYDGWVRHQLEKVMEAAANEFIQSNMDLFRSTEII